MGLKPFYARLLAFGTMYQERKIVYYLRFFLSLGCIFLILIIDCFVFNFIFIDCADCYVVFTLMQQLAGLN
jgi:hypothetical protein